MIQEKAKRALEDLKQVLRTNLKQEVEMYLFGSVARGDSRKDSDIDVMILLKDSGVDVEEKIFDSAFSVELEHNVIFGIVVFAKRFWDSPLGQILPLRHSIEKEGILL